MDLPGWNSIQTTGILSNFFFWVSIGALVLLGIAEVASHRYGEQRDRLVSQQHDADKQASDNEIARLHRDTAALTADSEKSRSAIAEANARAAEANQKSAEAALALEKYKAPRILAADQQENIETALRPFAGQEYALFVRTSPSLSVTSIPRGGPLEYIAWLMPSLLPAFQPAARNTSTKSLAKLKASPSPIGTTTSTERPANG